MIYFLSMKQFVKQIPHGGETEGRMSFCDGSVLAMLHNYKNLPICGGGAGNSPFSSCAPLIHPSYIFNSNTLACNFRRAYAFIVLQLLRREVA